MSQPAQHNNLLSRFARHPVAANLIMAIMLVLGLAAVSMLNRQFLPSFKVDFVSISVPWAGATAEDVETAIVEPLEDALKGVENSKRIFSVSRDGFGYIWIEFEEGSDLSQAEKDVERIVDATRGLPGEIERPVIGVIELKELIARVVVSGDDIRELRPLARQFERELSQRGITRVQIDGLPLRELAIKVPSAALQDLGMSAGQLGNLVSQRSRDVPAGSIGRDDGARQLRGVQQQRDELGFERMPLLTDAEGRSITLGDVATVEQRVRNGGVELTYKGRPAIEFVLNRGEAQDSLSAAKALQEWFETTQKTLPPGVELKIYQEQWSLIDDRINLLVTNGGWGLLFVVLILFLFLNGRVALWVTIGIPISFAATLMVLYMLGGTINMISLFALIMALGIIVDDAIVVGEDTLTHYQQGEGALEAAEGGVNRMFWPVTAAMITTVAAFLPLMLLSGPMGAVLFDLPLVVVCVIIASLVECFLVLPGHLAHALAKDNRKPSRVRRVLDNGFDYFRDRIFKPVVRFCVRFRYFVWSLTVVSFAIFVVGLLKFGYVKFTFFPQPESPILIANVGFTGGTPKEDIRKFIAHLENSLQETDEQLGGGNVKIAIARLNRGVQPGTNFTREGENYAHLMIELEDSDKRQVRNGELIETWRNNIRQPAGLNLFSISEVRGGPPGRDIEIRMRSAPLDKLKAAAEELKVELLKQKGILGVEDDTQYGQEQFLYELTPYGRALGLTVADVGRQVRSAYDGDLVQIFQDSGAEVEVRVMLADEERNTLAGLQAFPIILPDGSHAYLGDVVGMRTDRGFERLRHTDGELTLMVSADVDSDNGNANEIIANLKNGILPRLERDYGMTYYFTGKKEEQDKTQQQMSVGLIVALSMMYIILAWVFGSYGWPLLIMMTIPFGTIGAVIGHWVMGIDLTLLSMFGIFGLTGIVVNDSIVLIVFYRQMREQGASIEEAIVEAPVARLRAVLLTSLTTIAGLVPLLFETSLQAQFLIPMACSIAFGLAFATFLILLVVPAQLAMFESTTPRARRNFILSLIGVGMFFSGALPMQVMAALMLMIVIFFEYKRYLKEKNAKHSY